MFCIKNTPITGMESNYSKAFTLSGEKRKRALSVYFGDYKFKGDFYDITTSCVIFPAEENLNDKSNYPLFEEAGL